MQKKTYVNKEIYNISFAMRRARAKFFRVSALSILGFLTFLNLILFLISPVKQCSASMEPNIMQNSFLLSVPAAFFGKKKKLLRGDIVMAKSTQDENLSFFQKTVNSICRALTLQKFHPFTKADFFLARIAALPGDTIFMKDFVLYIMPGGNDFAYTEFELNQIPYSIDIRVPPAGWEFEIGIRGNFEKITLGKNEFFVLCDNRLASMDSRIFGAISGTQIKRKIIASYFPFSAFKILKAKKIAKSEAHNLQILSFMQ